MVWGFVIVFLLFGFEGLSCFTKSGGAIEQRNGLDFFFIVSFFPPQILEGTRNLIYLQFIYNLSFY